MKNGSDVIRKFFVENFSVDNCFLVVIDIKRGKRWDVFGCEIRWRNGTRFGWRGPNYGEDLAKYLITWGIKNMWVFSLKYLF